MELTNGNPAEQQHTLILRLYGIDDELYYVLTSSEREKVEGVLRGRSESEKRSEVAEYFKVTSDRQDLTAVVALDAVQSAVFLLDGAAPPLLALCEDRMFNTRIYMRRSNQHKDCSIADRAVAEGLINGFTDDSLNLDQFATFTSVEGEVVWLRRTEVLALEFLTSFLRSKEKDKEEHPSLHVWNMYGVEGRK